ncbi:hypothetical protein BD311DRAFT_674797 [Dichomitus squalens]|uniref:Uncharacterized protein n=1 Tax=Dichomitus squalens TaxID=114155 RepID=A0A4Q9M7V1_9APHY|nr:hypothetical protein BD311DRAFT_674797 [Dichomitus squalens]
MLNRIITIMVNRGAITAFLPSSVTPALTSLQRFLFPQTFVGLAFHNRQRCIES